MTDIRMFPDLEPDLDASALTRITVGFRRFFPDLELPKSANRRFNSLMCFPGHGFTVNGPMPQGYCSWYGGSYFLFEWLRGHPHPDRRTPAPRENKRLIVGTDPDILGL